MFKIINKTPLETSVVLHGNFRVTTSPPDAILTVDSAPPLKSWLTEWFKILSSGPIYKQMSYFVEPWTEVETIISSPTSTSCTLGFNDCHTQWTRHTNGIYSWDSKFAEIEIVSNPLKPSLGRNGRRGPMIAQDINLNVQAKSENSSWKVSESPITKCRYSPNFNYAYYKNPQG